MGHKIGHKKANDPAQRFRDKVTRKRDKERAIEERVAERQIAGGKFQTAEGPTSAEGIKTLKRETGTSKDPALARRVAREGEVFQDVAKELRPVTETPTLPQELPTEPQGIQEQSILEKIGAVLEGRPVEIGGREFRTGLRGTEAQEQAGITPEVLGGSLPIGVPAPVAATVFKVGKEVISNPTKVIQAGTAVKNSGIISNAFNRIKEFPLISGAAGAIIVKSVSGFLDSIGEKQQALNTLGQVATTIEGEATESSGDWRTGLKQIDNIEQRILELEGDIKGAGISSQTIKVDGRIFDINADIEDQLRTLSEARSRIVSFVLEQNFPELQPLEIQEKLRDLEEGGFIKPVDPTTSER